MSRRRNDKIAAAAIEVDRLRLLKAVAKKARGRQRCEVECTVSTSTRKPRRPCWRQYLDGPGDVDPYLLPRDEWCEGCRRRQAAHDRYAVLGRQLGGARRRLTVYVRQVPA